MLDKLKEYLMFENEDRITFEGHIKDHFIGKKVVVNVKNDNEIFCKEGVVGDVAFHINRDNSCSVIFYWIRGMKSNLPTRSPEFSLTTPVKIVKKNSDNVKREYHIGKLKETVYKESCPWLNFDLPKGLEVYYAGELDSHPEDKSSITVQLLPSKRRPFFVEIPFDSIKFNSKKELIQNSLF